VVYNHTPEGDESGPTLSWRGLDNASWYRCPTSDKDRYHNWSGCGNALNVRSRACCRW
jgi:pullulanase/glycogen debranching enzyme